MAELTATQSDLVKKYQAILDKNSVHEKVTRVEVVQAAELKGEQLGSVCIHIILHYESGSSLRLFLKQVPTNGAHLAFLGEFKLFEKEAFFFNTLLSQLKSYGLELDFVPWCLHAHENETLLENLVAGKGYHMVSKVKRQSLEEVKLVLRNLARLHAAGYALVQDAGGRDAICKKYPLLDDTVFLESSSSIESMFEDGLKIACELLQNNKVPGGAPVLEALTKFQGTIMQSIAKIMSPESKHVFHVLGHGDSWNNNMLFLDDPITRKPKHCTLIDFQCVRVGSPNLDLSYYMGTSIPNRLRRENWKQLLTTYFDDLKANIKGLNKTYEFPYSLDEFIEDYRRKFAFGFFMNVSMIVGEGIDDFDPEAVGDDMSAYCTELVRKWIAKHPKEAEGYAKELVDIWAEYQEIVKE